MEPGATSYRKTQCVTAHTRFVCGQLQTFHIFMLRLELFEPPQLEGEKSEILLPVLSWL